MLWMFAKPQLDMPAAVLALPGLAYLVLYWAVCQLIGVRLTKPNRGYDDLNVPWRTLGILALGILVPILLLFAVLVINRLLNPA